MARSFRWLGALAMAGLLTALLPAASFATVSRTVSLSTPTSSTTGTTVRFRGTLTHSPVRSLLIIRRRSGKSWVKVAAARTYNAAGNYAHDVVMPSTRGTFYYDVYAPATSTARAAVSTTRAIVVCTRMKVSLAASSTTPTANAAVVLSGAISPAVAGTPIDLQYQVGSSTTWSTWTTFTTGGNFNVTVQPSPGVANRYRAVAQTHGYYLGATSPTVTVTPSPPPGQQWVQVTTATPFYDHVDLSFSPTPYDFLQPDDQLVIVRYDYNLPMHSTTTVVTLPASARSFDDTSAQPNTQYGYGVEVWRGGVRAIEGGMYPVMTPAPPGSPAPLSSGTVLVRNATTVVINWTENLGTNYSGLMIRRAVGSVAPEYPTDGTEITVAPPSQTRYFDTSANPSTQYSYSLFPIGPSGGWASPTQATVTTPAAGVGWGARQVFDPPYGGPGQLACTSSTFCATVDYYGDEATYNGSTWSDATRIDDGHQLQQLACPSSTLCFALDEAGRIVTMTGGTWSAPRQLTMTTPAVGTTEALACGSTSFCVAAIGTSTYLYNGTDWSAGASSPALAIESLSCRADQFCGAGTADGHFLTLSSGTWTAPTSTPAQGGIAAISCPTDTFCGAGDAKGGLLTESLGTWSARVATSDSIGLGGVSCTSPIQCEAGGAPGWLYGNLQATPNHVYRWDGATWSAPIQFSPTDSLALISVSCVDPATCLILDSAGAFGIDNGSTVTLTAVADPSRGGMSAVSCVGDGVCRGLDEGGMLTQTNGTWGARTPYPARPAGNAGDQYVESCPTDQFCAAIDMFGQAATYSNGAWSANQIIITDRAGSAISCASRTLCLASLQGAFYRYDGSTWAPVTGMPSNQSGAFSCVPPSFCMVNFDTGAYIFDGSTWTLSNGGNAYNSTTNTGIRLGYLACTSVTFCIEVYDGGYATWNGVGWTSTGWVNALNQLMESPPERLACGSRQLCVLTTPHGATVFDGSSWTIYSVTDGDYIQTAACISATECEALSADSEYLYSQ